ncbi:hypothetical protein G7K71_07195 [Desulfofundulus sp. TPOSR]|uniref:hypothetical protein n=1 Tax=Desulfofundulus sp. TPOSR TaxID=2714340 RepID=UPI00140A037E|nr:hypothetical protein [Desulfofundulus sp. TPOSR]NHM26769.1 hypothetical protein [Desulfofundulus sp. TPOSR]
MGVHMISRVEKARNLAERIPASFNSRKERLKELFEEFEEKKAARTKRWHEMQREGRAARKEVHEILQKLWATMMKKRRLYN